jgi:hypothetical protein
METLPAALTVFGADLAYLIVGHLQLTDVAYVALRIDRNFSAAARRRIAVLQPKLTALLATAPFVRFYGPSTRLDLLLEMTDLSVVCGMRLGDAGLRILAGALCIGALPRLVRLNLGGNDIRDHGLALLVDACVGGGALLHLRELRIHENEIGDAGIAHFSNACALGALTQLEELHMGGNDIGDDGLSGLAKACARGALPKLEHLFVEHGNPRASREAKEAARALGYRCLRVKYT